MSSTKIIDKSSTTGDLKNQDYEIDIMALLHQKKLSIIEKEFNKHEKGLELEPFVKTMLEHLDYPPELRFQVTLSLIELFKEIDVNGDATMEWEEFSNHIIELGLARKDTLTKKDKTSFNVIKNYFPSENLVDTVKHYNEIEKVYFFEKPKYLFVLERDAPNFKVYDANTANRIADIPAHKGAVLSADCYQDDNGNDIIVTTSNDLTINFWEAQNFTLKQRISTPEIQHCVKHVRWSKDLNFIYTGGSDAIIHYYDAKTLKPKGHLSGWNPFAKRDVEQNGHAGPITDLLPIHRQSCLVSAGLDGQICLWDIPSHTFKKELKGHEKGVYSLDWCEEHNFLFSAGLDHEAYVWNTYVKEKILPLRGHNHPLVGVRCVPQTDQVITADISGMVKIWDVRNFMCVQTFNISAEELYSFTVTYPKKRIVTGSRSLGFFEYDEPRDQLLTDEKMCLKVLYDDVLFCFITLHPNSVKIWEAKTGKLLSVHRNISKSDLVACCLDDRKRKLIVGDIGGRVYCINVKNGARMKKFEKHQNDRHEPEPITDLAYWKALDDVDEERKLEKQLDPKVITASKGSKVKVHDDSTSETKSRYKMESHTKSVNCLAVNREQGFLASCADDGLIVIMNLMSYRQEGILKKNHVDEDDFEDKSTFVDGKRIIPEVEVKKVLFLSPHHFILSCDAAGKLSFWTVAPNKDKNTYMCSVNYYAPSFTKNLERFPVSAIAYDSKKEYLFIGDEFGHISIWDISQIIEKMEIILNDKEKMKLLKNRRDQLLSEYVKKAHYYESKIDKNQSQSFLTQFAANIDLEIPGQQDIKVLLQAKKLHNDGVTHIEIIEDFSYFATSSFDCCVHIWAYDGTKIGSLILGRGMISLSDKDERMKWNFDISHKEKEEEKKNHKEATELLRRIQNYKHKNSEDDLNNSPNLGARRHPKSKLATIGENVQKAQEALDEYDDKISDKSYHAGGTGGNLKSERSSKLDVGGSGGAGQKLSDKEKTLRKAQKVLEKFRSESYSMIMGGEEYEGKNVFDEDDDDQDYHILQDLDFKTNNLATMTKGIFKSKPMKTKIKAKLK